MKTRILIVVIGVLIAARLALPEIGRHYINKALNEKLGEYEGHLEDFDLSLYRGAYQLQGLEIRKKDSPPDAAPFARAEEIDLSISWRALLKGKIAADAIIKRPQVHFADSEDAGKRQMGNEEPAANWRSAKEVILPLELQTLKIDGGAVDFVNRDLKEPLPVRIDKIKGTVEDIRIHRPDRISSFDVSARVQEHAFLTADGRINALSQTPRWDINFIFEDFSLETINDTLRAYIPIDVTAALLSLYGEAVSQDQTIEGYVKVFLKEAKIIEAGQDILNVKHLFFEIAGAFANWFLKNDETDNVATLLPFKYENGNWDINTSEAFWSAIENKSDELEPRIDRRIGLPDP